MTKKRTGRERENPLRAIGDITEHKRAEQALRQSEEHFRELVENVNEAIYEADASGRITYISPVVERVLGYSPSEMVGRSFAEFIHPDDLPTVQQDFRQRLTGIQVTGEYRVLCKSRQVRWVRSFSQPLSKRDRVVGLRGVVIDITERKRAEEALRESEERFRTAFERAATGMALVSVDGRILQVNKVCCEVLGYSEQELKSMTWQAISHADDLDIIREYIGRVLAGEMESYQLEKRFVHKDGHVLWGHLTSSLLRDANGRPLYFISQIQDITERKLAEDALRESEERYRDLVELSPYGIAVHSEEIMMFVNRAWAELLGAAAPDQIVGKAIWDFVHPDYIRAVRKRIQRAWRHGRKVDLVEEKLVRLDGQVIDVEMAAIPIIYQGKAARQVVLRDITERKQAEEALRASEDRYRTLVEAAPDVIYALAMDGTITSLNSAFESISGWSRDGWLGKHFASVIHPDDLPAVMEDFRLVLQGGVPPMGEYRMLTESGQYITVETVPTPLIVDGEVVGTLGIVRDLTQRKEMEETLQKVREELESKVERQMLLQNPYGFSFREFTVLYLVTAGQSDREIGITLGISPVTAQKHVENLRTKMKAASRIEASVRALREGLLG